MSDTITLPAPVLPPPPASQNKWASEYQAFRRLLPQLMATHRGKFVAIHEGKVVDSGDDKLTVALRVLSKIGNIAIHVGLVSEEPEPIFRSGIRRDLRTAGDTL